MRLDLVVRAPARGRSALVDYFGAEPCDARRASRRGRPRAAGVFDPRRPLRARHARCRISRGAERIAFTFGAAPRIGRRGVRPPRRTTLCRRHPRQPVRRDIDLLGDQQDVLADGRPRAICRRRSRSCSRPLLRLRAAQRDAASAPDPPARPYLPGAVRVAAHAPASSRRHGAAAAEGAHRDRLRGRGPGDWMLHCHILEHQETGMMGYLRVADAPARSPSRGPRRPSV